MEFKYMNSWVIDLDGGYILEIRNYMYTLTIRFMPCNLQGVSWTVYICKIQDL